MKAQRLLGFSRTKPATLIDPDRPCRVGRTLTTLKPCAFFKEQGAGSIVRAAVVRHLRLKADAGRRVRSSAATQPAMPAIATPTRLGKSPTASPGFSQKFNPTINLADQAQNSARPAGPVTPGGTARVAEPGGPPDTASDAALTVAGTSPTSTLGGSRRDGSSRLRETAARLARHADHAATAERIPEPKGYARRHQPR